MEKLQQIVNGPLPVLIDFHADWCGPCKAMNPVIQEVGKQVQGKARVLKINVDNNPAISQQLGIQAVPTFVIMKQGKIVWRHSGMIDKHTLLNQLGV